MPEFTISDAELLSKYRQKTRQNSRSKISSKKHVFDRRLGTLSSAYFMGLSEAFPRGLSPFFDGFICVAFPLSPS